MVVPLVIVQSGVGMGGKKQIAVSWSRIWLSNPDHYSEEHRYCHEDTA